MITKTFDPVSKELLTPDILVEAAPVGCDVCIMTFSHAVVEYAVKELKAELLTRMDSINGPMPIYTIEHKGKKVAFFKTPITASAAGTFLEEARQKIGAKHFIMFGSSGSLDESQTAGALIVPTEAYRDEGTSYHYAEAADFITMRNWQKVAAVLDGIGVKYVTGKVWTTDALYRETVDNARKRREAGCIAVDMECSAIQAICDFRGIDNYHFIFSGDILHDESWDRRILGVDDELDTQRECFMIALELGAAIQE